MAHFCLHRPCDLGQSLLSLSLAFLLSTRGIRIMTLSRILVGCTGGRALETRKWELGLFWKVVMYRLVS